MSVTGKLAAPFKVANRPSVLAAATAAREAFEAGGTVYTTVVRVPSTELVAASGLEVGPLSRVIEAVEAPGFRLEQVSTAYQTRDHYHPDMLLATLVFRRVVPPCSATGRGSPDVGDVEPGG